MVDLAEKLESKVIAEGIETREEYWALRECGVTLMQGYLLAKPMFEGLPEVTIPEFGSYLSAEKMTAQETTAVGVVASGLVSIGKGRAA